MTTETNNRQPTHRIYAVTRQQGGKAFWNDIGAAWANRDGKGFSLKLNYLPLNGADLVVREPLEASDANGGVQ